MFYRGEKAKNISFPLGGIGTGCIGLTGNGELIDWEIFNRPNKNTRNGYSHFAIKATQNGKSVAKVLHGDTKEHLLGTPCASSGCYGFGYGPRGNSLAGFPHFNNVEFEGNFPIANVVFSDDNFPAIARLCAFNPFIPHDDFNSSLPVAFFEWEIENITDEKLEVSLALTVCNPSKSTHNEKISVDNFSGVYLGSEDINDDEIDYLDISVMTDCPDTAIQEYWYRGALRDGCTTYWNNFKTQTRLCERSYDKPLRNDHGVVASYIELEPKEIKKVRFVIAWNVPNAYNYWSYAEIDKSLVWKNYYATQFKNSVASAAYALSNFSKLYEDTLLFSKTLQSCTLPDFVKDAISSNLSVIKTATALRLEDGSFWGWEGCNETVGSCEGTCQHVWNYAYVMPYLFPKLERTIREMTTNYSLLQSGATAFRTNLPLKKISEVNRSCLDGQMGEVIKSYREWKFSGDDEWLKKQAEHIFSMLEYAWSKENPDEWDLDMDGVLEGRQHHTLDMEIFGPSSWLQGLYLLALDCAKKMATYLGQESRAKLYAQIYEKGKKWTNENLFNGKYFYQKVDISDKAKVEHFKAQADYWNEEAGEIKYQVAEGCIIDQMLADWHAKLVGVKQVFDTDKKKEALKNLYKNNYKPSMREVENMWRNFSLNDEAGTVMCTYPDRIDAPIIPIPYCEETMTGFEYALAGLMITEGFIDEGEKIVKSIRDRYDGEKRNPWNEIECGNNYARSMASYALMPIYSGFSFDMVKKHIGFKPIYNVGEYLFSVCESWGKVTIDNKKCNLEIYGKPLTLRSILVPNIDKANEIVVDGVNIDFEVLDEKIAFKEIVIKKELRVEYK